MAGKALALLSFCVAIHAHATTGTYDEVSRYRNGANLPRPPTTIDRQRWVEGAWRWKRSGGSANWSGARRCVYKYVLGRAGGSVLRAARERLSECKGGEAGQSQPGRDLHVGVACPQVVAPGLYLRLP